MKWVIIIAIIVAVYYWYNPKPKKKMYREVASKLELSERAIEIKNNESVQKVIERIEEAISKEENAYRAPSTKPYYEISGVSRSFYISLVGTGTVTDSIYDPEWREELYSQGQRIILTKQDAEDLAKVLSNSAFEYCEKNDGITISKICIREIEQKGKLETVEVTLHFSKIKNRNIARVGF